MKAVIIILFLCLSMSCSSQSTMNKKEDMPILTEGKNDRITFSDSSINDSLRIRYKVVVYLDYPLQDTTKVVNVQSFELYSMSVISQTTKETIINYSYDDSTGTTYQKYIWNLCYNKLKYWYMKQRYQDLIDRLRWGKMIVLGGTLYIIPT